MLNKWRKFKRDSEGAAMIEMAFVLPIFVFMTLAIFEIAIIYFYSFVLESAMYNVTRFAKVQDDPQAVVQEVRDKIGELSLGLMNPAKVIITTDLAVNFADDWENAEPEQCTDPSNGGAVIVGQDCLNTSGCGGNYADVNSNNRCDIGAPGLELGVGGAIISYVSFYKKPLFTPTMKYFAGSLALPVEVVDGGGEVLISSATVVRNEPPPIP